MADKKQTEFTITDRRRFTGEGDATSDAPRPPAPEPPKAAAPAEPKTEPSDPEARAVPPPPSEAERQAQHEAFKESAKKLDDQLRSELGGRRAQDFEMTFENFIASIYMMAMVQLGLMHERGGQPQVDLLGARQSIDTLGLLADKTKGNLTAKEDSLLQGCLYELRMAYVEVTNAIAREAQAPGAQPPSPGKGK